MALIKPKQVAERLGISYPTVKHWIYEGKLKAIKMPGGHYRIPEEEIDRISGQEEQPAVVIRQNDPISVRNRLLGEVVDVRYEGLFAEVVVSVGEQQIISIITRSGCEALGLKKGMPAYALFKATEVMIGLA